MAIENKTLKIRTKDLTDHELDMFFHIIDKQYPELAQSDIVINDINVEVELEKTKTR